MPVDINGGKGTTLTVDSSEEWSAKTDASWIHLTADKTKNQIIHEYDANQTGITRTGTPNYAELHGTTNAQYSLTLMRDQGVFGKAVPVRTITIDVDRNTAYQNRYQLVSKDIIMDDEYTNNSDIDAYAFDEKGRVTLKFAALDSITKEECYIGTHTYGEKKGTREFRLFVDGDPVLDDKVTLSTGKYNLSLVHYSGVIVDTLNIEVLTAPPQLSALDFGVVYTADDIPTMLGLIDRTINLGHGVLERYEISGDNVFIKTGSGLVIGIRSAVDNGPAGVSDAVYDFLYDHEVFDTENVLTEYLGAHNEEMELVETLLVQEIIATELEVQLVANGYYTALSNIEQMKYDLSPDLMAEMEKELLPDFVEGVKEMLEEAKELSEELYEEPLFVKSLEDLTQIESTDDLAYLLSALGYGDSPLYDELISLKYPGSFPKVLDRCYKKNPAKYEKLKNRWDSVNEWKDVLEESGTWLGVIGEISNGIMGYAEIEEKTRQMANMAAHNKVKQKLEVLWNSTSTEHKDVRNAIEEMLTNLSYYADQRKEDIAILNFKTGGAIGVTILTRLDDLGIIKSKVIHNAVSAIESLDGYKLAKKTVGTKAAKVGATALFVWDTVTSISNTFLVDGQTTSRLYNTVQKEIELLEEKKEQLNDYRDEKMSDPAKLQNLMYTSRMLINATTEHEISYYQLVYDVYVNEDWWRQGAAQIGEIVYGEEGIQETLDACMTCISDCQSIRKELLELSK